jgi:hypothetical protein
MSSAYDSSSCDTAVRQTKGAAQLCEIFLQVLHPKYAIHGDLSTNAYPIHLGTPSVDSLANVPAPLSRVTTKRI